MSADGFVRLDGRESGSRPPLVLVHGVGLDHTMWDLVVDDLAADRLVIRYDLLGHGRSPDPPGNARSTISWTSAWPSSRRMPAPLRTWPAIRWAV